MRRERDFAAVAAAIWSWTEERRFRGSDPYDGLNSRLLAPFLARSRLLRLAVIQLVKRSPIDLRPLLWIPPGCNPKGLALMLHGLALWSDATRDPGAKDRLGDMLLGLAATPDGEPAWEEFSPRPGMAKSLVGGTRKVPGRLGWGYDFPWQSKAFLQPAYYPTVVVTAFAADALAAAESPAWPLVARAVGSFVADSLARHEDETGLCFSYSPRDGTRVFNASLFGARLLVQAAEHAPREASHWRTLARRAVDYVAARQRQDGSWVYGEASHWQWVDNLHTGFNLETMGRIAVLLDVDAWDDVIDRGLSYYRHALFEPDGTPRYYAHRLHPIDPHSFAQGAITFLTLERFWSRGPEFAAKILERGIDLLWDDRRRGFRFQRQRLYAQGQIHLRWSQAWMFKALCALLAHRSGRSLLP